MQPQANQPPTASSAQLAMLRNEGTRARLDEASIVALARQMTGDDSIESLEQLTKPEASQLIEGIKSGALLHGQPSANDQMGDMPAGF